MEKFAHSRWGIRLMIAVGLWGLIAVFAMHTLFASDRVGYRDSFFYTFLPSFSWAFFTLVVFWLGERFRFRSGERWRSLLVLVGGCALVVVLQTAVATAFSGWLSAPFAWRLGIVDLQGEDVSMGRAFRFFFLLRLNINVLNYIGMLGVGYALDYYEQYKERDRVAARYLAQAAQLKAELTRARLDALKSQLQPHFLFNTLHGISALMERDVRTARQMMELLSEFLRLTLEHGEEQELPLERELEVLQRYLAIQQMRFRDALVVSIEVPPETRPARVPYLILQPLVENALEHGRAPRGACSRVVVRACRAGDELVLHVVDNGPGLPPGRSETDLEAGVDAGIGLRNTRRRLQTLYGDAAALAFAAAPGGGLQVTLRLPFYTHADVYELTGAAP